MTLTNPFFDVKPLEQGSFTGIIVPQTGAEFRWNPMTTLDDPAVAGTAAGGAAGGAFYTMRTADNGDIYLQGGQVSGWGTPVDEILLYTASTTSWSGSAGQILKMTVTGTGAETSGILDPSFTPTGVSTPAASSSLGSNTYPSSGSLSGKVCQISLGSFVTDGFQPAGIGNIQISFCWSGYTISRF